MGEDDVKMLGRFLSGFAIIITSEKRKQQDNDNNNNNNNKLLFIQGKNIDK